MKSRQKTVKNGKVGWICLEYATLTKQGRFSLNGSVIKADSSKIKVSELSSLFKDGTVSVFKKDGTAKKLLSRFLRNATKSEKKRDLLKYL